MKRFLLAFALVSMVSVFAQAQAIFDEEIEVPAGYAPVEVVMPPSPLSMQILFIGATDMVQTTETYGNAAGETPAKQWHDFIGFTPDNDSDDMGWISVNHEMIQSNDMIGDGGGMTVFKVKRDADTDTLQIVEQTLNDGRSGKFFNVDFANTVGETGMNCGGITSSVDGRIWTAEEWFRTSNGSIRQDGGGVRDTSDYTITNDKSGWGSDVTVKGYENFNYMVEIDPKQAVAIRKQYNWGRQGFEGGAVLSDNKTVFLGWDGTPAFITKFVADTPGDFTEGTLYCYKHDSAEKWFPIENNSENMLDVKSACIALEGTLVARIEWVVFIPELNKVYMTETGNDGVGDRWDDEVAEGAVISDYHHQRAFEQGLTSAADPAYADRYGRVVEFDLETNELRSYIEGGPNWPNATSPSEADYFSKHLSNPDGLNYMLIGGKPYLVICEDLNGTSYGRTPEGVSNRTCELFLLDLAKSSPLPSDLIRLSVTPQGAEITGA